MISKTTDDYENLILKEICFWLPYNVEENAFIGDRMKHLPFIDRLAWDNKSDNWLVLLETVHKFLGLDFDIEFAEVIEDCC